jgi:DNA-directed RNA polymerase specialized sigma24 family protein
MDSERAGLFEGWEIAIVVKLVSQFRRRWSCLELEDVEELKWMCLEHWYEKRQHYDRSRGASRRTFLGRVTRNKLMDFVRSSSANKRKATHLAVSLDLDRQEAEGSRTPCDELDEAAAGEWARRGSSLIGLALDVERAMEDLSLRQRDICRRILERCSVSELSELLETPRATIYDEIGRIRRVFAKRGLEAYLR